MASFMKSVNSSAVVREATLSTAHCANNIATAASAAARTFINYACRATHAFFDSS